MALTIHPWQQLIQQTGLIMRLSKGLHGEVYGIPNQSWLEPWFAPGLLLDSETELKIILANLSSTPTKVYNHQLLGYVKLEETSNLKSAVGFGGLEELGLSHSGPSTHSLILRESLKGLTTTQQDQALALFEK
ncbi:hypothetical protein DSO57_1016624 [Entomophthora muscae]|uniref:Uncharacterized protein n=1 Tax=Entomophthora muscae TaxID=34485 RepID=A0ACC2T4X7_9FUNG|nr:hypothetical protein DSO57_1016624 [Entomophthora muscae]